MQRHDKLVRDKIPDRIKAKGERAVVRTLSPMEFEGHILGKLVEEAKEVRSAKTQEDLISELADVLEVVDAICETRGVRFFEVVQEQRRRRKERGAFKKRIFLIETD
jgi:predicted house-cleaning noncanonical NTP pyrophosphatase (MazG superfamily)